MEPTSYSVLAQEYYQKWSTAVNTVRSQRKEIEKLKREITELKRSNYRLLDKLHIRKEGKGCLQKKTV